MSRRWPPLTPTNLGFPLSIHHSGGWREYCLNRVEIDSARPMFRKETASRLRSIVSGYYYMHYHRMLQSCNWEHTLLYYHSSHRIHTHDWTGGNSHWRDASATMTYPLAANQQFWVRVWNGCWTNWNTSESMACKRGGCCSIPCMRVLTLIITFVEAHEINRCDLDLGFATSHDPANRHRSHPVPRNVQRRHSSISRASTPARCNHHLKPWPALG